MLENKLGITDSTELARVEQEEGDLLDDRTRQI